jgi:hypothetical protein
LVPAGTVENALAVGTPLTRISCRTGLNWSVPLFQVRRTFEAVTVPTVSPLGVDGAVVSGRVVTVTGSLGVDALYMASKAVTLNVRVWLGRSDDHVAVVWG